MTPTDLEDDVHAMLDRRAADLRADEAPARPPTERTGPTVVAIEDRRPAPSRRATWIAVAAAVILAVPIVALVTTRDEVPSSVQSAPGPGTIPEVRAEIALRIEVEGPTSIPAGTLVDTIRIGDDGLTAGVFPGLRLAVADPTAAPGAPGSELVTIVDGGWTFPVGPNRFRITLMQPCPGIPNCFGEPPDHTCDAVVEASEPKTYATFRFASDGSCLGLAQDDRTDTAVEPEARNPETDVAGS